MLALCLASCVELVGCLRGVVYSKIVLPKSSVEVPCMRSLVWTMKILLLEGGDVE